MADKKKRVLTALNAFVVASNRNDLEGVKKAIKELNDLNVSADSSFLKVTARQMGIDLLLISAYLLYGAEKVFGMPYDAVKRLMRRRRKTR